MMDVEVHHILEENGRKKIRRRKKQLYNSILVQMEFYFSDANLRKDRLIRQLLKNNPYVDLSIFLNFNKITALTNKVEDIATALEKSEILKLSEDNLKVCRVTPICEKINETECTIYVERLPEDTHHDWLKEIFSSFGAIDYVSLPKYKHNKRHKGFAFIEFSTPESAQKAIEYFESIGCKLPTKMPPNQLASIVTYESDNVSFQKYRDKNKNSDECIEINVKEKLDYDYKEKKETSQENETITVNETLSLDNTIDIKKKKRKLSLNKDECDDAKKVRIDSSHASEEDTDIQDENIDKKKRKRKKSKKNVNDFKQIGLKVLSKREWKQLRNKYLNMQRFKMKALKDQLYRNRYFGNDFQTENTCSENINDKEQHVDEPAEKESEPRFKYTPGCIISFTLPETCSDIKKFKVDVKSNVGVEFVDIHPGKDTGFVRFSDDTSAKKKFLESSFMVSMEILQGKDEQEYWNKITLDRETKLKKCTGKKLRGREKLLKKAEQELGKHIRFENK